MRGGGNGEIRRERAAVGWPLAFRPELYLKLQTG